MEFPAEYFEYLQTFWAYFPYMLYSFALLTLLPKSFCRIQTYAKADYEANRHKYHRCYAPDICCHTLSDTGGLLDEHYVTKQKPRKAVTRVYPKKVACAEGNAKHNNANALKPTIKRQVQPSTIQTHTSVNKIAQMFESGGNAATGKKINRVLPEIRMQHAEDEPTQQQQQQPKTKSTQLSQLLQENIENSANLINQATATQHNSNAQWHGEAIAVQRRARPITLGYAGGTSTTPSTASPEFSSSSPHSSAPSTPPISPVQRRMPLNMQASLEDIFAAIARNAEQSENFICFSGGKALAPVTSIDDILSQRRLSRPLSAYSISDLLNEENGCTNEAVVENFLQTLSKT